MKLQSRGLYGILGSTQISHELSKVRIKAIGFGCDAKLEQLPQFSNFNEDVSAVVVGMDRNISFNKLVKACTYIEKFNCLFITCNYNENMQIQS
jgi:ribonucleotide monophosphatase NagD (HAD superfamily)